MPRCQTKCMRVQLAENASEPPTNVGRDPQGGERDGPQGGRPARHCPPRACEGGKGRERWVRKILANRQGNERGYREGARGVRGAGFAGRGELGKVEARLRGRLCAAGGTRT